METEKLPHAHKHREKECCRCPPKGRLCMATDARNADGAQQSQPRAPAQVPQRKLRAFLLPDLCYSVLR